MNREDPLIRLLDEGRLGQSSESRERERMLRQIEVDGASLVGTLVDLAERSSVVTVRTDAGRVHHGELTAVGRDFCVLVGGGGQRTYLRTDALATVRPHPHERHPVASGDRCPPLDLLLAELLALAAPERPRVVVVTRGSDVITGDLVASGSDVLTIRIDGDRRSLCYVATAQITEVAVDPV